MNLKNLLVKFSPTSERSKLMGKNIAYSFIIKVISIVLSLLIVPATIHYVSSTQYGIWLTLSSIVGWISYFDIGFGHGLRYQFAEAVAKEDYSLAKKYVSTTYVLLTVMFTVVCVLLLIVNHFLDWSKLLNLDPDISSLLNTVFALLIFFFCLHLVLKLISTILTADQRPALAALIEVIGQFLAFITIIILSYTTEGSLLYLVFVFSGLPCVVLLLATFGVFRSKRYMPFSPTIKSIDFTLTKNIIGKGFQYFFTMISMFLIFQLLNIIITRELGPDSVTQYNVAYKYYNVLMMAFVIIVQPMWSAFTEAYTKKDYAWMRNIVEKIKKVAWLFVVGGVFMFIVSPWIFKLWVGNDVNIPILLSFFVFLQNVTQIFPALYVYPINGMGKMRVQIIIYSIYSIFAVPALILLCRQWGIPGVLTYYTMVYITLWIFCRKQFYHLVAGDTTGVWSK